MATSEEGRSGHPATARRERDPRLDFFRGVAMLIIFVSHIPANSWSVLVPGRYGFSDSAELFVFCSGYAAAIAFGGTFRRAGFLLGTARILQRCWQLYWAHIALFVVMFAISALAVRSAVRPDFDYIEALRFDYLVEHAADAVPALLTLTYVPNLVDILPMYMVLLALMPVVILMHRLHPLAALAFVLALYAAAWAGVNLPAQPGKELGWFFNPFGWSILFYAAFAISAGWIAVPGPSRLLTGLALLVVALGVPITWSAIFPHVPVLQAAHDWMARPQMKGNQSVVRTVHFLALAYLAVRLLDGRLELLRSRWAAPVVTIGQQALPTFLTSMALAWAAGIVLDGTGRTEWTLAVANVAGILVLVGVAYLVAWYRSHPWQTPRPLPAMARGA